jgi:hypothetical protein
LLPFLPHGAGRSIKAKQKIPVVDMGHTDCSNIAQHGSVVVFSACYGTCLKALAFFTVNQYNNCQNK